MGRLYNHVADGAEVEWGPIAVPGSAVDATLLVAIPTLPDRRELFVAGANWLDVSLLENADGGLVVIDFFAVADDVVQVLVHASDAAGDAGHRRGTLPGPLAAVTVNTTDLNGNPAPLPAGTRLQIWSV